MFANKKSLLNGFDGSMILKRSLVPLLAIGLLAGMTTFFIKSLVSNPSFKNVVRMVEMVDTQEFTADQNATEELLALGPEASWKDPKKGGSGRPAVNSFRAFEMTEGA
jgi:hypothetical protein